MSEERPFVTVDAALFTLHEGTLSVALSRRDKEPFRGALALPGGWVHTDEDEDLLGTATRMLREKTGLLPPYLEQLYCFGSGARDPRGWSISIAYFALIPEERFREASADAFTILPIDQIPDLPFDHNKIVNKAVDRLRSKATYSSLPGFLLPDLFTLNELQQVYEQVIGRKLSTPFFRKKIEDQEIVQPVEGMTRGGAHRPAQLFRLSTRTLQELDQVLIRK